jgi:hypothetical protein
MEVATYNISVAKVAQIIMERFLDDCRQRGADAFNDFMASEAATGRSTLGYLSLTGFPAVVEIERAFLPAEAMAKYDTSIAEYDPRS